MEKEFITINDSKLQIMQEWVWTSSELPLLATAIEFKYDNNGFQSGFIMGTYGAVYFFKAKMFGAPEYSQEVHLLDCREFTATQDNLTLRFDGITIQIKSKEIVPICYVLLTIFNECTYGVKDVNFMRINLEIEVPNTIPTERPRNILRHRALFLAHFYRIQGEQLHTIEYFDKFDDKPSNMLVLGPHCHPGNFATAFGHAIAWETSMDTIVFQANTASKFPKLFDALLQNSQTIDRVAFTDYKDRRLPAFDMSNITDTRVKRYWFMRDCGRIICEFMEKADGIPVSMQEIVIASCSIRPQEFGDIVTGISEAKAAQELQNIYMVRVTMKPFPFDDVTRLLGFTRLLESLTIRSVDVDATHLLRAVCAADTHLRALSLTHMQFRTDISPSLIMPKTLLMLNVSFSAFSSSSFKSLIEFLTMKKVSNPIIFQAQALVMKTVAYAALEELDFKNCQPNMCEIDWSGNHIPKEPMRFFFAFLFTQTRNRLLMMNEVSAGDSAQFLSYLAQLVVSVPLPGLDVSGKFPSGVFAQFVDSLSGAPGLMRLKLRCKNAGDGGLEAFARLVPNLPKLTEIIADGFRPRTPQPFFELWRLIDSHPSVEACDVPQDDLNSLGLALPRMNVEMSVIFERLLKKARPSTVAQRLEYMIEQARSIDENETIFAQTASVDADTIFAATRKMNWKEVPDEAKDHVTGMKSLTTSGGDDDDEEL